VRGEPEICVENRAHHFHGVAAEREIVCDDQRDEAGK
jgi:hypothetical protein